jgi:uncharacterized protein (DUF2141 family)
MAFKHYLIFLISICLSGCAEVGTISGGPKDEIAPRIIKSSIENGMTNFKSQSFQLTFDEFIQLNKPSENIFLVPQDAKLEFDLVKKSLNLKLTNDLKKNTTYTLYLNAAVKDVTEGNDSLIQFTFSTGPRLDSLKFVAQTIDAFSNNNKSKITVGLFDSLYADKPIYFGQSNQAGVVTLTALKEGSYFCKAFEDKNKDLQIQKDEAQDWNFEPIQITGNSLDTFYLRLSSPLLQDKIKNVKIIPPALIGLHVPKETTIDKILLNGSRLPNNQFWKPKEDSLQIAIGVQTESQFQLIVNSDTFNLRRIEKNKMAKLSPKNTTRDREITNLSSYEILDYIELIDSNKIEVLKLPDSIKVNFTLGLEQNKLTVQPKDKGVKKYIVIFQDGAIKGLSGNTSKLSKTEIIVREEREFGSLNIRLNRQVEFGIMQILDKEKVVDEQKITSLEKPLFFSHLNPGEYTFRIIEDLNQNDQWDPISPNNGLKAERVFHFSTPVKVRSNWEVETTLELK